MRVSTMLSWFFFWVGFGPGSPSGWCVSATSLGLPACPRISGWVQDVLHLSTAIPSSYVVDGVCATYTVAHFCESETAALLVYDAGDKNVSLVLLYDLGVPCDARLIQRFQDVATPCHEALGQVAMSSTSLYVGGGHGGVHLTDLALRREWDVVPARIHKVMMYGAVGDGGSSSQERDKWWQHDEGHDEQQEEQDEQDGDPDDVPRRHLRVVVIENASLLCALSPSLDHGTDVTVHC